MITEDEVRKIASLARLYVTDEEAKSLSKDLSNILDYVQKLESVDIENVEPMSHVHGITNIYREDRVEQLLTSEEALKNAPDTSGSFIRVPIIIDQGGES